MNTMRIPEIPRAATAAACLAAFLGVVLAAGSLVGCSDNRMSLNEFLELQRTAAEPSPAETPVCAAATGPAETQPAATQPAADQFWGPYKVGPGDVLAILISGVEQTGVAAPMQSRVDRDGNIDLPIVGKLSVAGLELQDVEDVIQNAYVPSVYRQAAVHVELARPEMAYVLVTGAVSQPGLVQLPRSQRNLLYAIAGAGGVSNVSSGEVLLRRLRTGEQTRVNILEPEQLQRALTMAPLQNGDVVVVQAAAPNVVFVGGLVQAPHQQVNPPGTTMNVLQALASAGGLRTDVTPTELTLIRRLPDGRDLHVKLDVDRIQKGKDPNITLAPGDILWAPETVLTRVQAWANQNLFLRAGVSATVTYNVSGLDFLNDNAKRSAFGVTGNNLEQAFDPFGFLIRQNQLSNINNQIPGPIP